MLGGIVGICCKWLTQDRKPARRLLSRIKSVVSSDGLYSLARS